MPTAPKKGKTKSLKGLEGCYIQARQTAIRVVLDHGQYRWGTRDIHDSGTYRATRQDDYSCLLAFSSKLIRGEPRRCQLTRRGKMYLLKVLPNGEGMKLNREDGGIFLKDSLPLLRQPQAIPAPAGGKEDSSHFCNFMFSAHPEWSLWAVEAPIDSVTAAFAALGMGRMWARDILTTPPKRKGAKLVRMLPIVQSEDSPWVVGFRSVGYIMEPHFDGVPREAEQLSRKLKTRSISFMRQDTAGCIDYRLFDRGKVAQKVCTDEEPSSLDKSFRHLGLYIPACMLDDDGKNVILRVQPASKGRVERADIILLNQ